MKVRSTVLMIMPILALALAGCSSDKSSSDATTADSASVTEAPTSEAPATETSATEAPTTTVFAPLPVALSGVGETTVEGPVSGGGGQVIFGTAAFDGASFGYTEEEFFIAGEASSFTSSEVLADDGLWTVDVKDTAAYKTRILVRRPIDAGDFSGTVFVEWLNVTAGLDTGPTWSLSWLEMLRQGSVWVGVSTQRVGVEGGGNKMGEFRVLKIADPARYGSLNHPGDNYSYDIFSQAGATVWRQAATILGGLEPVQVIAAGESQSAFRMTTYLNAVAPLHDVYNGYLVHSRGARAANLFCAVACADPADPSDVKGPLVARIRTDLTRPVLNFSSETDVVGTNLGYRKAEQPDTEVFRSWEVTGTAHGDAYSLGIGDSDTGTGNGDLGLFEAQFGAPSSVYMGIIECGLPINAGPHTYVLRSALRSLDEWVRTGVAPASMPKLENNADLTGYNLDANGNALGGIRTPFVDVPLAALSGIGQEGGSFCGLFGTTRSLTADELAALYPTAEDFVAKWNAATDAAVESGAILAVDAEQIKAAGATYAAR